MRDVKPKAKMTKTNKQNKQSHRHRPQRGVKKRGRERRIWGAPRPESPAPALPLAVLPQWVLTPSSGPQLAPSGLREEERP